MAFLGWSDLQRGMNGMTTSLSYAYMRSIGMGNGGTDGMSLRMGAKMISCVLGMKNAYAKTHPPAKR